MKKLFAVKDRVAEVFTFPIVSNSTSLIKRDISELLNKNEENYITVNYKDKELYDIGSYDETTGNIILPPNGPTKVIELQELKQNN